MKQRIASILNSRAVHDARANLAAIIDPDHLEARLSALEAQYELHVRDMETRLTTPQGPPIPDPRPEDLSAPEKPLYGTPPGGLAGEQMVEPPRP
jgi:hypothetical protein